MHEFNFQESDQTLFIGKNGSGKSTLLDALIFVLYGKAFRKLKLEQIINSINRANLYVEVEFSIGNTEYKVCRGMRPDVFEIYINDELKDQMASKRDHQKFLENNILKMSEKTFKQIVILGSTSYIPFMRLDKSERRDIIEDLLDIQVFSLMNMIIKDRGYILSREYKDLQTSLNLLTTKCDLIKEHSEKSKQQTEENKKKTKDKLEGVQKEIDGIETSIDIILDEIEAINTDAEQLHKSEKKLQKMKTLKTQINSNLKSNKKSLEFFKENEECPVCEQDLDKHLKTSKTKYYELNVDNFVNGIDQITSEISNISKDINGLSKALDDVKSLHNRIKNHRNTKKLKNELVREYEESLKETDKIDTSEEDNEKIFKLESEITEETGKRNTLAKKGKYYSVILEMLKDSGIKTSIIKSYLPIINKLVRKYLDILEFNVDYRFDENFSEVIKSRNRDTFSYANFSEGEKMRIDLALLFVWRELTRMRNSAATNLLIMDEIGDSSLDADGFESFMKIIRESKYKQNVIIISHKVDMVDKFTSVYSFQKKNDFSELNEQT